MGMFLLTAAWQVIKQKASIYVMHRKACVANEHKQKVNSVLLEPLLHLAVGSGWLLETQAVGKIPKRLINKSNHENKKNRQTGGLTIPEAPGPPSAWSTY